MKMLKKYPKDQIERNEFYVDPGLVNKADYQEPVKTGIGKIPVIITDPHNEVLPFWYKEQAPPATLLHIDAHPDTCANINTFETSEKQRKTSDFFEYAQRDFNIASFIAPAIYYKIVDSVYWVNPREDIAIRLETFTREEEGKIRFTEPIPRGYEIHHKQIAGDLEDSSRLILDIDLDAFECLEDKDYWLRRMLSFNSVRLQRFLGKKTIKRRFAKIKSLLKELPAPDIITIAQSQTPVITVPPENVGFLECQTLDMLVELYDSSKLSTL